MEIIMSRTLGPNVLHQILLEQARDAGSLEEAAMNLKLLHAVLVVRLSNRGIENPTEGQVYYELSKMMEEK
jgi:hypothetical protein